MGLHLQVEQLEHAVAHVAGPLVLAGLGQERLRVQLVDAVAARELHLDADRGVEVLSAQQAGAVAGQFGFALPFHQCGDDRPQRPAAERDEAEGVRQPQKVHQHRAVHGVTADSACPSSWPMTKRISSWDIRSYRPEVMTMNGVSMPMQNALTFWGLDDEQLGFVRCVEHRDAFVEKLVEIGELTRAHPRGAAQVEQAVLALAQHRREHLEHLVETLQAAQRREGDAVGGMLPCA